VSTVHVPILLEPIVEALVEPIRELPEDAPEHTIVDCTLGGGGHTQGLLEALAADPKTRKHRVLSVDQDENAIARARERFAREISEGRLELVHARFSEIAPALESRKVIGMMADLGFSSDQLEDASRGLSFQGEGPLDMRLDPSRGESCQEFLAHVSEAELKEILQEYGEERFSGRIASAIVRYRQENGAPRTTKELSELIVRSVPPDARYGRIHAATRTFQALRIVVNQELEELDAFLKRVTLFLTPRGRVAVISFHSLEDRMVKQAFKGADSGFRQLTKKPIEASEEEVSRNPRSRSAKLRIAERI
jgi:16S rRNA (cytosine1402-N4)-methyltransferase